MQSVGEKMNFQSEILQWDTFKIKVKWNCSFSIKDVEIKQKQKHVGDVLPYVC